MTMENTYRAEHCCCDVSTSGAVSTCRKCGKEGKPDKEITLKNLVKKPRLESIDNFDGFYFCETPGCEVIYFSNGQSIYLHKADVTVRVGIKETDDPIPVCYCFGWTRKKIFDQFKQQGFSTAVQEIGDRVKARECACEVNNPTGKCCLGGVNRVVNSVSHKRQEVVT